MTRREPTRDEVRRAIANAGEYILDWGIIQARTEEHPSLEVMELVHHDLTEILEVHLRGEVAPMPHDWVCDTHDLFANVAAVMAGMHCEDWTCQH